MTLWLVYPFDDSRPDVRPRVWPKLELFPRPAEMRAECAPEHPECLASGLQTAESHAKLKENNDIIRADLAALFAKGEYLCYLSHKDFTYEVA